ncbi:uncharacterized protein LOC130741224 isoform X3 [Lotus japonicus]|uniref:uncharacterized protein LOC130741224 isoform X3 n=1 Tax=Lotus japonicus TaxID=34305 RepID=UPI00258895CF|nr:uncharacterized protein LOC130741224 isoform X3 [Lotus japonicus]
MSSPFIVGGQVLSHEGLSSSHIEQELTSNTEPLRKKSKRGFAVRRPNMQRSKKRLNMMVEWETSSEGSRSNTVHSNPDFCSGQELLPQQRNVSDCTNNFNTNFAFVEAESQMYFDLGEMNMACQYCGAILWYHERAQKAKNAISPDFSICCMKGKISLPYLQDAPTLLSNLLTNIDPRSGHFIDNIRSYNSMFAFTSIGGKVDGSVNNGQGPPQFVISGQNYHRIGSLLPAEGDNPKFAQLNIYDTRNEFENRLNHFSDSTGKCSLNSDLVVELMAMVDEFNVLAKSFRRVRDHVQEANSNQVALRLFRHRVNDPKTYNLPTVDEVAALIVEDFDTSDCGRDIILRTSSGNLQRIYDTHSSFLPLQYPLIFPYGEEGFSDEIGFDGINYDSSIYKRTTISLREWVAFRLQERQFECKRITLSRRLLQQLVVDCYSMIESQRLYYLRNNQETIRRDFLSGIEEAIHRGDTDPSMVGSRIVLPSSFTGGRRYMFNNCQDAMGICREYGYPDLFLTMTCNPKWPEIERHVSARCLSAYDRPDLACRVFRMKLDQLMKNLKKGKFFGQAISWMYTIEFQKRGLPHAHILLWLSTKDKLHSIELIDSVICAELPDPKVYPLLYQCVSNYMVHGPCGVNRTNSPCMKNGRCSKFFPKNFVEKTSFDSDGYPVYRRRNTGISTNRRGVDLDNGFVVPYNPKLLMKYQAHINIEYCNKSNCIKYLFKYINKGVDRVTMSMSVTQSSNEETTVVDEIKQYHDCRYLSPCEAVWRTFSFYIHDKWPPVLKQSYHLPKKQVILFNERAPIDDVLERNKVKKSMFLAWMEANCKYPLGRGLTYAEFPSSFVYDKKKKEWHPRKKGICIGRMNFVPPGSGELYYLRMLLNVQRGCTSFEDLRSVNNHVHDTFRQACLALSLLKDDREYIDGILDVATFASGSYIRELFVSFLLGNAMADPSHVWRETWSVLADGIVHALRRTHNNLEFDSVMQLSLKQHPWKIKVRVIAVWNVDHLDQAHGLRCMHMVLIDKEHVKIQASFHKYIPSKLNIIQGRVYVLSLFRVKRNMDSERVTNHGFKLLFNSRTRIVLDVDAFIPYYGWDFLDFGHVQSSWGNFNYLIDVAGLVKAASNVKLVVQNSGITKVMVVDLQDTRGTVRCILMGDIVDKFADYMASNWTVQPVMGLQFMAVYYVRGKVILQTLPHLTKMHIDPVFDNERGIGDRLLGIGNNQPIEYIGHRNCEHNILDDMLVVHPKKTIGQLLQTTESGIFVVHVGILAVIEEGGWWYPSCRCYTKLTVDNGVYHCGCCERTIGKMLPRFSIKLEVFDGFDSTVFLLQDSEAIQLMHSSCVEVVTSEGLPNAVKFPVHLKDMLVGKEILCKIRKSTGVTYKGVQIYEIIRISFDQYMLELFHADDVPKIPPPAGNMDGGSHHEDSSMIDVSQGNDIDEEESGESSSSVSHNSS